MSNLNEIKQLEPFTRNWYTEAPPPLPFQFIHHPL
jgi:hypothetical protein